MKRSVSLYSSCFPGHWTQIFADAVVEDQFDDIINVPTAWLIADDETDAVDQDLKTTNSARQVKSLVEQVKGRSYPNIIRRKSS